MRTNVQKWGNSLALRIPRAMAGEADLSDGAEVEIAVRKGKLIVARARPRYALSDLLAALTDENLHHEAWPDAPRGNEAW